MDSLITLFTVQITTSNSGFKDKAKLEKQNGLKSKQLGCGRLVYLQPGTKTIPRLSKNVPSFRRKFLLAKRVPKTLLSLIMSR
jgi:hypothetical protein